MKMFSKCMLVKLINKNNRYNHPINKPTQNVFKSIALRIKPAEKKMKKKINEITTTTTTTKTEEKE